MSADTPRSFAEVMTGHIGETTWTGVEVYLLGEHVLNWVATTVTMGHANPGSLLDYVKRTGLADNDALIDFVAWTSGRKGMFPGCEDRLRQHIVESGWQKHALTVSAESLGLNKGVFA